MSDDILFAREGRTGVITLNRPKAFNAITLAMFQNLQRQLSMWSKDDTISQYLIEAVPGKAFCSGGDVRSIYDWGHAGDTRALELFKHEYPLNAAIKRSGKPYIALLDGLTMGGGVGVSLNGNIRIASENFSFGMPETGIGLFPDVGASFFLSRCPGEIGMYLGLTGQRLKAADALYAGLIDHFVPADDFPALRAALFKSDDVPATVKRFTASPGDPELAVHQTIIDEMFSSGSVEEIMSALAQDNADWSQNILRTLSQKSPTSLKVTYRQLREGAKLSFDDCMRMEFRITSRMLRGHDLYEGIRAVVIDKDMSPEWDPSTLAGVTDKMVAEYFAPLEHELEL